VQLAVSAFAPLLWLICPWRRTSSQSLVRASAICGVMKPGRKSKSSQSMRTRITHKAGQGRRGRISLAGHFHQLF
jgi:hypothetical protein